MGMGENGKVCNWECYLKRYPELKTALGVTNLEAAKDHYYKYGKAQNRNCACDDPAAVAVQPAAAGTATTAQVEVNKQNIANSADRIQKLEAAIANSGGTVPK